MKLIIILLFALVANCDQCSAPVDGPGCFSLSSLANATAYFAADKILEATDKASYSVPLSSVTHITSGHIYTIESAHFHKFLSFGSNGAVESSDTPTKF